MHLKPSGEKRKNVLRVDNETEQELLHGIMIPDGTLSRLLAYMLLHEKTYPELMRTELDPFPHELVVSNRQLKDIRKRLLRPHTATSIEVSSVAGGMVQTIDDYIQSR